MNEQIFQKALQTVASRRLHAKSENDRRYREVDAKIPQIAEINRQLAQTAGRILDTLQQGEKMEERLESLKRKNLEAQRISATLLQAGGYPADQNRDGAVTLTEAYDYLLLSHAASTPQVYPQKDDFVLYRYDRSFYFRSNRIGY